MSNVVDGLLYTDDDEWLRVEENEAIVGITDYAQDSLSDIVYVELPAEGESYGQGDSFGVVESVKAAADLYMPADGEIIAINENLLDEPELINDDPYGAAWMVKFRLTDKTQLDHLMDADAYRQYLDEREG